MHREMTEIETRLLQIWDPTGDSEKIDQAARLLREGKTVIIPTETVYGLAADALCPEAVAKIFAAKGRPQDNPLILHIDRLETLPELVTGLPEAALLLAERFWPGPLTMVLPKSDRVPYLTSGGLETVGVRMPAHPVARAIIARAGVPLAAPSANRSGSPSPTTAAHCIADMLGRVDAIVESGDCLVGVESTVVSLTGETPRLLRPGAITPEQLRQALGSLEIDPGVWEQMNADAKVSSPGMKYKHYSPLATVVLIRGSSEGYARYLAENSAQGDCAISFSEDGELGGIPRFCYGGREDHAAQASRIFALLRQVDADGYRRCFVHAPGLEGIGLAVYNRLIRAAAFKIIDV